MPKIKKISYILAIVLSVLYLLWRVFFTIPWHAHLFTLIFALMLVGSEIVSNFTAYVLIAFRLIRQKKPVDFKIPDFDDRQPLPAIDVIIVTHNEEVALLRKTVNAAKFMKYPDPKLVNVVIADDGNRPEVRQLAKEYHANYVTMEENKHAKAGNINNALEQLHAPLFAIFDADMVPFSNFLMESVPFFTENFSELQEDPDHTVPLGFVQTPQSFYNADIFQFNLFLQDAVVNEQDFFSRDVNVLNGANGHALFTGSNAVFLREAVDKVGGFPTDTITEDFELGTKINSEGYKSLATVEPVSSGITPVDMKSVIKQRTRWARGVIQSCRNLHIFLNPKINLINRIILINTCLYWWSFLRRLIYIAAPILYALFKVQVVNANFWVLMIVWAPGYFLLHFVLGDASSNIRNERWGEIQETFFAPYLFLPVLLESIGIHAKKFKVTDKKVQFSWRDKLYIIPYLILWSLTLIAIIKFNWGKWGSEIIVGSVITFWLVMHFINLSFCLFISMKRDIHRRSERFIRHANGRMQLANGKWADFKTRDVSDGGFSFELDDDQNQLEMGTETTGIIYYKNYPIHFKSKVVRVVDTEPKWYGVTINIEDRKDQDYYLELTYDGENKFLSKEQDNWLTPFDQLHLNVILRLKELERSATRFMRRS
ncbi:glycosyltransferase family 2 protein [Pediococcus acidilactici]|uniref:glycosyltransferase family 2 protein n=1 Tax=Pediococcus acidilactici TaxID=1254 RepID=UPI00293624D3|nr:glycosyltransferase family 2 protein [Pediococcus acidilactici]MDV2602917.1 glycosyltransferase [Pediococcus acidilactici]MDV2844339.1 glycosyltransferase [Pediococcus acidilactici]WQS22016.1 glycosyltransferase [Pediococcus acidilactici]WQS27324.1 glycosyltransferase [Pediococcus acidilactici]